MKSWSGRSRSRWLSAWVYRSRNQKRFSRTHEQPVEFEAPWTVPAHPPNPASHPSEDQFEVDEAVETAAAVNELVEFFESKRCTIESDRSCDHCGACRRLGF